MKNIVDVVDEVDILIVWDVMLDRYTWGSSTRLSPEAPVPVITKEIDIIKLWWAANVAENLVALWISTCLIWNVWDDDAWKQVQNLLNNQNITFIPIVTSDAPTIEKTRIMCNGKQIGRLDTEISFTLNATHEDIIIDTITKYKPTYVVISDYAKGVISQTLMQKIDALTIPLLIDTKPKQYAFFEKLNNIHLLKPNFQEFVQMIWTNITIHNTDEDIERYAPSLAQKSGCDLVITRSEKWASLVTKEWSCTHFPTQVQWISDVSWAWDTFLAWIVYWLQNGYPLKKSVEIANYASAIVVAKSWTAVVTKKELEDKLKENNWKNF